jgi:hypothetical protein
MNELTAKTRKVLLVEINEVTWNLIDPLIEKGELPTFALLKREGAWASPTSVDLPPMLEPWITWTTVYTGRPQPDHKVEFLQQPPETIEARRLWEICHQAGLTVGVYGSLCSWPPQPVKGFYVPDTFAPDTRTYPQNLQSIQKLNLTYTRSIRLPSDEDGLLFKARLGANLLSLGLSAGTVSKILRQLARERWMPKTRWQRVALQPFVNFDFFSRLYRRHRPDFASFHTNHVAHYMHTYWKAMQPDLFPQDTSEEEKENYGGAIAHGYRMADELLKRMMRLLDDQTVMVVASSMGQKPYVTPLKKGKRIGQLRSLDRLVEILDAEGHVRTLTTMSDQFNLYPDSSATRDILCQRLSAAYIDLPERPMFYVTPLADSITVTHRHYDESSEDSICVFPHRPDRKYRFSDLIYGTGMVKSGCHDPVGILMVYGPGVPRGLRIDDCTNLNIAPTLLTLLGLEPAPEMKGRVLNEVISG